MEQNKEPRPLGILGGMGPEATQYFYQLLIRRTPAARDQEHIPALIISDAQMPDRTAAILSGDTEPVYQRLLRDAKLLESCGCGCVAIPCNTSHYFADRLQEELNLPLLNMPRLTLRRLAEQGKKRIALLATTGTVQAGVYRRECQRLGLELWTPEDGAQAQVMSLIYDVIKRGAVITGTEFDPIDAAVRASGCDCAVLGCTELSVYRGYCPLPEFYTDAMEVLAESCISFFGRAPLPQPIREKEGGYHETSRFI